MWTEDDVRLTRWQRLNEKVKALPLETAYRWLLVAASVTMLTFSLLGILHYAITTGATVVTWLMGLV
jgi:hypothetical protein